MKILITGGGGYLGAALLPLFAGEEINILDMRMPEFTMSEDKYRFFQGSITDRNLVKEAAMGVDIVVHLAGIAGVEACRKMPIESEKVNVEGMKILLEAAKDADKILFTSSSVVYGNMKERIDENKVPAPNSLYGEQKLKAEALLINSGIDYTIIRPSNLYGPSPIIPDKYLIHRMAMDGIRKGQIWVSSAELMRNFIHVRDSARAIKHLLESEIKGEIFNLGHVDMKLIEIAELIKKSFEGRGKAVKIVADSQKEEEALAYSWQKLNGLVLPLKSALRKGSMRL